MDGQGSDGAAGHLLLRRRVQGWGGNREPGKETPFQGISAMRRFCGLRDSLQGQPRRDPGELHGAYTPPLRAGARREPPGGRACPHRDTAPLQDRASVRRGQVYPR